MALVKRSLIWADSGGRTTQTIPTAETSAGGIMTALQAHSQAAVIEWWEGTITFPGGSPGGGSFAAVSNVARLTFATAGGQTITVSLPSPSADIFEADTVTVDASAIADIIAACVGTLATLSGDVAATFVSGVRNQLDSSR